MDMTQNPLIKAKHLATFLQSYLKPEASAMPLNSTSIRVYFKDAGVDQLCYLTPNAGGFWTVSPNPANLRKTSPNREQIREALDAAHSLVSNQAPNNPCPECGGTGYCGGLEEGCECGGDCPSGGSCPECKGSAIASANTKFLSLSQPWAWAIFDAGRNIENRTWATPHRGRMFIHTKLGYDHAGAEWIQQNFGITVPGPNDLPQGAIVGRVDLVEVMAGNPSKHQPWAIPGYFHWYFDNVQPCTPIPWFSGGDLEEDRRAVPDEEEMVVALNQVLEEDLNIYAAIVNNDLLRIIFWDGGIDFLLFKGKTGWYFDEALVDKDSEGWGLRFNICKEALFQAYTLISSGKLKCG